MGGGRMARVLIVDDDPICCAGPLLEAVARVLKA